MTDAAAPPGTDPVRLPDDPIMRPYWEATLRHELVVQRCRRCGHHQFYARPFCLACVEGEVEWVAASGLATIYAATTVHMAVLPGLEPPYVVAVVQLDEGPRLTTNVVGADSPGGCRIGGRVRLAWRDRVALPPLPVFEPI